MPVGENHRKLEEIWRKSKKKNLINRSKEDKGSEKCLIKKNESKNLNE
jgi:hypothetical protein